MSLEEKTPTDNPDNTEKPSIPGIPEITSNDQKKLNLCHLQSKDN